VAARATPPADNNSGGGGEVERGRESAFASGGGRLSPIRQRPLRRGTRRSAEETVGPARSAEASSSPTPGG